MDQLVGSAELFFWFNWIGAIFATVANWHGVQICKQYHLKTARRIFRVVGALSSLYIIAYVIFLFGPFSYLDWARQMRIVSMVAWMTTWSLWGLMILRVIREAIRQGAEVLVSNVETAATSAPASELGTDMR